jgi:hypothetical protein
MSATITITNKNATATTLVVDGVNRPIGGSGSITVDEGQLTRLLADNISRLRFQSQGDLTHSALPAGGPQNVETPAFSITVDLSATATTPIVTAAAARSWISRGWRATFSGGAGATVTLQEAGALVEGFNVTGTTSPLTRPQVRWATAPGNGLDVAVTGGAAGTATVDCWGAYV